MRKLKNQRGETILEVMLSLLVVSLCVAFFVTSLVTANKETKKVRNQDSFSFQYGGTVDRDMSAGNNIKVEDSSSFHADVYGQNGYYYVKVQ